MIFSKGKGRIENIENRCVWMKADKILITVLVLSLTVAAFTLYQRSRVEEPYYRVELVADYEQYKELAPLATSSTICTPFFMYL